MFFYRFGCFADSTKKQKKCISEKRLFCLDGVMLATASLRILLWRSYVDMNLSFDIGSAIKLAEFDEPIK